MTPLSSAPFHSIERRPSRRDPHVEAAGSTPRGRDRAVRVFPRCRPERASSPSFPTSFETGREVGFATPHVSFADPADFARSACAADGVRFGKVAGDALRARIRATTPRMGEGA